MGEIFKKNLENDCIMKEGQKQYPTIVVAGDCAILVVFGNIINEALHMQVIHFVENIKKEEVYHFTTDIIPAFCSVLVEYDATQISYSEMENEISRILNLKAENRKQLNRIIEIPVCYGGKYGEDLTYVAKKAGLSCEEVINIHSGREYLIYMIGFMPGFPYLGGLDQRIYTPRLSVPRVRIPAGSVGIGGKQTGVYPIESPGGWQLIGKTPVRLYKPEREEAIIYQAGDYIRFISIKEEQYEEVLLQENKGQYQYNIITKTQGNTV